MLKNPILRSILLIVLLVGVMLLSVGISQQVLKFVTMVSAGLISAEPFVDINTRTILAQFSAGALYVSSAQIDVVTVGFISRLTVDLAVSPARLMMHDLDGAIKWLVFLISGFLIGYAMFKWFRTKEAHREEYLRVLFLYEALTIGVVVVLFPFFWMISTAFKPLGTELIFNQKNPFDVVPPEPTVGNFKKVLRMDPASVEAAQADPMEGKKNFGRYFLNSLKVAFSAAFLVTLFASMGAYVFSKKELPYKKHLFKLLLMTMMIPGMMYMVPQFFMICKMGLFGSWVGMFLPHLASVFGIFMLKQFMDTIPNSLLESARIDGASDWQIFRVVIVPLAMPIILTLFLLTFLSHWSNFLWQLIVCDPQDPLAYTLPVALALFRGQYTADLGLIMSASCFSIVPITILFLFAQRYFIEGMTAGAVKE